MPKLPARLLPLLPLVKPPRLPRDQFFKYLPFPILAWPDHGGRLVFTSLDGVPPDGQLSIPQASNGKDIPNYWIYEALASLPAGVVGFIHNASIMQMRNKFPNWWFEAFDWIDLDRPLLHYQARYALLNRLPPAPWLRICRSNWIGDLQGLRDYVKLVKGPVYCMPCSGHQRVNNKKRLFNRATLNKPWFLRILPADFNK